MKAESGYQAEKGVALITVLVFLVLLTLVGMTAMHSSGMQERMSANLRDQDVSFQATESAVREGETWVEALNAMPPVVKNMNCPVGGPCDVVWEVGNASINSGNFLDPVFWSGSPNTRTAAAVPGETGGQAQLVIEYMGTQPDTGGSLVMDYTAPEGRSIFRVTGRGPGETPNSVSVIQTTYAKKF